MDYTISLNESGNEVTTWDFPEPTCGDFPECHDDTVDCGCAIDLTEPPVGEVIAVTPWTLRENVRYTVGLIRHARQADFPALEVLFTNDLRALLATRSAR